MKSARTASGLEFGLGLVLGLCVQLGGIRVALSQTEPAGSAGKSWTIDLEYTVAALPVRYHRVVFQRQTERFTKEPDFGSETVQRGRLQIGSSPDQAVGLIWSSRQGKLYLDLNRNKDLTDDSGGVYTCQELGYRGSRETFTNVLLTFPTSVGAHRQVLDLYFYQYRNDISVSAQLRSFWTGKLALQDEEWQIGLVEGSPDQIGATSDTLLLLRPWSEHDQPFNTDNGTLEAFRTPTRLFFLNRLYEVKLACQKRGDAPAFQVQLTEQPATLGNLELAGESIHRLILRDNGTTIVLDDPPRQVQVPLSTYTESHLQLKRAQQAAHRTSTQSERRSLAIRANEQAVLKAGGPLTNQVTVRQAGRQLRLSYTLIGADGYQYRLQGPRKNPRFAIFQGGQQIASGQFEFG